MVWLWILAAVVLLIVLLLRTRVGAWAAFGGEGLRLDARVGPLRIHILPARPKKAKKPPREKKEKPAKEKPEKPEGARSFTLEDGKDALRTLLPPLKRALARLGRGVRVKPLRLSLTLGGQEDPAAAAQMYGELQAAVWTGMPLLERLVDIRDTEIHTEVDFNAPAAAVEGEVGITLRVGTLLAMGFGLAFPALKWFLRWRKRCKARSSNPTDPERTENPAA